MASRTLYPPLMQAYAPSFTKGSDVRIYFAISPYNTISEIYDQVLFTLVSVNTNQPVTTYDVMLKTFRIDNTITSNYKYYITLTQYDLKKSLEINQYYKAQIRFISSRMYSKPTSSSMITPGWLLSNADYYSEVSTASLVRNIDYPKLNVFGDAKEANYYVISSFDTIDGYLTFGEDSIEEDQLNSYKIEIYDTNNNLRYQTEDILAGFDANNRINHTIRSTFGPGIYYVYITFSTLTGYTRKDMFPVNYKKEYTPFSSSVVATAQNERGTIELAIDMLDVRHKEVEIEVETQIWTAIDITEDMLLSDDRGYVKGIDLKKEYQKIKISLYRNNSGPYIKWENCLVTTEKQIFKSTADENYDNYSGTIYLYLKGNSLIIENFNEYWGPLNYYGLYIQDSYFEEVLFLPSKAVELDTSMNGILTIKRAASIDNFKEWIPVSKINLSWDGALKNYIWEDYTAESNIIYRYMLYFDKLDSNGSLISYTPFASQDVALMLDDMFILGDNILFKNQYNPTVSGFKYTTTDAITNTLGGKYPYVRRNGDNYYRTFQFGGLISINSEPDIYTYSSNVKSKSYMAAETGQREHYSPSIYFTHQDEFQNIIANYVEKGYKDDFIFEKLFRDKIMNFLNDGKPKLFKSSTEGNIIVRLTNVSFTPNQQLGRQVYSFTATATEIDEFSYDNLLKYNIIDADIQDKVFYVLDAEAYDKENGDVTVDKSQIIEPSTLIVNKIKQS